MTEMSTTLGRLTEEVDEAIFTRGVQAYVSIGGETVLDVATGDDGLGREVGCDTLFRVYCTIKPVTALALGHLVDAGVLDLDAPLDRHLPAVAGLRSGVTARHVLTHSAGLHRPSGVTVELMAPERRAGAIDRQERPSWWRLGVDVGYSEYAGWYLLGRLIEELTGEDLRDHLRSAVLDPLGLHDTFVGMTADEFAAVSPRIGVNLDLRGWQAFPMLYERTERVCRETNGAHGGYTTARDLGRLYQALLRARAGDDVDGLPSPAVVTALTEPARPPGFDIVLDRECTSGLGFMTGLGDHYFGSSCSIRAFGHSGNVGSSFALADPDHDLAVAVVFNGIVDHESAFLRRPALLRAIHRDLGLDPAAAASVEEARTAAPRRFLRRRRDR